MASTAHIDRSRQITLEFGPGPQGLQCPACDKTFPLRKTLNRHLNTAHSAKAAFHCQECGQSFNTKYASQRHLHMRCRGPLSSTGGRHSTSIEAVSGEVRPGSSLQSVLEERSLVDQQPNKTLRIDPKCSTQDSPQESLKSFSRSRTISAGDGGDHEEVTHAPVSHQLCPRDFNVRIDSPFMPFTIEIEGSAPLSTYREAGIPEAQHRQVDHLAEMCDQPDGRVVHSHKRRHSVASLDTPASQMVQNLSCRPSQRSDSSSTQSLLQGMSPYTPEMAGPILSQLDKELTLSRSARLPHDQSFQQLAVWRLGLAGRTTRTLRAEYKRCALYDDTARMALVLQTGKVKPDERFENQYTALLIAAYSGSCAVVRYLTSDHEVDVTAKDANGDSVLILAAMRGHFAVCQLLLSIPGVEIMARNERQRSALMLAAKCGHVAVCELLASVPEVILEARDEDGETAFMLAAKSGHAAVCELLASITGVNVDASDEDGETAFMLAAKSGHAAVCELLASITGVNVDARDEDGETAFMLAAKSGHAAVCELLASIPGVNVEARDEDGETAFMLAAKCGHVAVCQLLTSVSRVDIEARNGHGETALFLAAQSGHVAICEMLIFLPGVGRGARDKDGRTVSMLYQGADINARSSYNDTALHAAARNGHKLVVKLLLENGADINARSSLHDTALHTAARNGREAVVKLLLNKGANMNARNGSNETALHSAAYNGHKPVVELLLGKGADANARSGHNETALHIAVRHRHKTIVKLLQDNSP